MSIFEVIVLGLTQGLTEFIPVSSSGHLILLEHFFSGHSDHLFVQALDIGTTLALIIYFWPRLMNLAHKVFVERDYRLARNVIITSVPAGLIGLSLGGIIEKSSVLLNPFLVATMLGLVGILMIVVDKLPHLSKTSNGQSLTSSRALVVGVAQAFALIPGVSRSGSTIVASRFMGLNPAKSAEYSFLVAIPILLGLIAKLLISGSDRAYLLSHLEPVIIGNVAAFVSGIIAIRFMLNYLSRHGLAVFGWYRVVASLIVLGLLLLQ